MTLDNASANGRVPWSLFGNRWYVALSASGNNDHPFLFRARVGSEDGVNIKSITWLSHKGLTIETAIPHGYEFMATCNLSLSGIVPAILNGVWSCFITGDTTFEIRYLENPGPITSFGHVDYNVNLVEFYTPTSALVFRDSTQNFEVIP